MLALAAGRLLLLREAVVPLRPAVFLLQQQRQQQQQPDPLVQQARGMARGRNHYLRGASNKDDISPEARDLLINQRDPEDRRWQLGPGIQEPIRLDLTTEERKRALQYIVKYKGDRINDGEDAITYYPHAGEEIPQDPPSPLLLVQRVKPLKGEPKFNKNFCLQIGLGQKERLGKRVILPNLPSVSLLLFKIKHLLEIRPITFPNGYPEDFDPERHGSRLTINGEFRVFPSLRENPEEAVEHARWLRITDNQIVKEARRQWDRPFGSPLGHHNYHKDTRWTDNEKADSLYVKSMKKKWSD